MSDSTRLDSILAAIPDDYEKTPGFPTYDLAKSVAIVIDDIDDDIEDAVSKLDVDNLEGEDLERFVYQRKAISRKAAKSSIGILDVVGTGTITKGDLFETANSVQFKADATAAIVDSGTVNITAIIPGTSGIVGANSITLMPVSIPGIVSVVNPEATYDGYEAESDADLRTRYYSALQTPPTSGNKYQYRQWALEVVGVGDARVYPLDAGDNTVTVVIIDSDKQPANAELVGRVQEYIDPNSEGKGNGEAPIGAYCTIASATALEVNLTATITIAQGYSSEDIEPLIEAAVTDYLKSIPFNNDAARIISYALTGNAIIDTAGVLDYESLTINSGTANIEIADRSVPVLGTVVFTYA